MLEWGLEKLEAVLEVDLSGVAGAPPDRSLSSSLNSLSLVCKFLGFPASFLGTTKTCAMRQISETI